MKIIINENQYRLLIEHYEHTRFEIVNFANIDLQHEYDKLNKLLFDNKLPKIQITWSMAKNQHGRVKSRLNRLTNEISVVGMTLSKFYSVPYHIFTDTLAHEMIHVNQAINNVFKEINQGHGPFFIKEMNRINNMGLGFNVSITLDAEKLSFTTSEHVKAKQRVVLVSEFDDRKKIHIMTEKAFNIDLKELISLFDYLTKSKYKEIIGKFYLTNIPQLERFHVNRKISGLRGYGLSNSTELEKIIDKIESSKYLGTIYSSNGETLFDRKNYLEDFFK